MTIKCIAFRADGVLCGIGEDNRPYYWAEHLKTWVNKP